MSADQTMSNPGGRRPTRHKAPSKQAVHVIGVTLVIGFLLLLFWRYVFVTILPGHVGVLYSWLYGGTQVASVMDEGLRLKLPWNRIYVFETRVQTRNDEILALSAEGMEIRVKLATLFRVRPIKAGELLKQVGPDYEQRIVYPLVTGAVREVISRYNSVELYTVNYKDLEQDLYDIVDRSSYAKLLYFNDLIVREILLPPTISNAIEQKLAQEQVAASYTFRLETERQEAEQRRIRALGIQNFYAIVSDALNKNLLTWRGIEATVELAQSNNSKIVIVGSGENQLPLILGSDIHNLKAPPKVEAVTEQTAPPLNVRELPELFPKDDSSTSGINAPALGVLGDGTNGAPNRGQQENQKIHRPPPQFDDLPTPKKSGNVFDTNTDGLIARPDDGSGLTSPSYQNEGVRRQPLQILTDDTPESSPYGTTTKD